MNLSPLDFLEVGLRKARRNLQTCTQSAEMQGLLFYVPDAHEGKRGTFALDYVLFRHIDHVLKQIDERREKEVDEAGGYHGDYGAQLAYDEGLKEVAMKKKLAAQLGYESFSDIPRKA